MKIKLLFTAIIVFLFSQLPAQTNNNDWFWQYPKPQGNTLRNIKALYQNTAIATGDFGTFIKTTDGGESWDVKSNSNEANYWRKAFFTGKENGWSVSGKYIYTTKDGGENWETIFDDSAYVFTDVYFINNQIGWIFGINNLPEGYLNTGYCFRTTDGGLTWNSNAVGYDCNPSNPYFISPDSGWVFTSGFTPAYFLETTDGGLTWTPKPIKPNIYLVQDVCFLDKNNWSLVSIEGFSKTTNSGQTWIFHEISGYMYSVKFINADTGWAVGGIGVTALDTGIVLYTTDGGTTWEDQSANITEDLYSMDYSDGTCWAAGRDGAIYRTTDLGKNWIPQRDDEYGFNSIYFIDKNNGWVVGKKGIILHTSDGGNNWVKQYQNDSLLLNSVYAVGNGHVFAVGSLLDIEHFRNEARNAILLLSTDMGQTWETKQYGTLISFNSIFFIGDSVGWIAEGKNLLKTTDKGYTWDNITNDPNKPTRNLQFINEDIGWGTVYGDYNILKTTDGGKKWKSTCIDSTFTIYSFHFINANIGWAAGIGHNPMTYYSDKYIYKTTDGGDSWIECRNVPQFVYSSIKFIDEKTGWAAGTLTAIGKTTIIKTTDGGNSWFEQKTPIREELSQLYFINDNIGYAVGYNGIFKTVNGGGIVSVKDDKDFKKNIPIQIELKQNYPNPFNPTTTINYQLPKDGHVTLKIYDILGKEIATLVNEYKSQGRYSVEFNAQNLASGTYIYELRVNDYSSFKKLMLLK